MSKITKEEARYNLEILGHVKFGKTTQVKDMIEYDLVKDYINTPPPISNDEVTADEIVKEFQKTRTYETVVYRDCGDFALLNDKNKGHYELSNIYCIVSKSSLDFPFGTTLKLAHDITKFFMKASNNQ